MKYYKSTNILFDKWVKDKVGPKTDEPETVKQLEREKKIHKLTVGLDGDYTYFCSEDIVEHKDLAEINREDLDSVYSDCFPDGDFDKEVIDKVETIREDDDEDGEILDVKTTWKTIKEFKTTEQQVDIDKEIDLKSKRINYAVCGANWTGAVNGGTFADGDVITGNLTNADTYTFNWGTDVNITVSGNYYFDNQGKANYDGTAGRWSVKSSIAAPLWNSWVGLIFTNIDADSVCKYGDVYNTASVFSFVGTTDDTSLTIDHMYGENIFAISTNTTNNTLIQTISNSKFWYGNNYFTQSGTNSNKTIYSHVEIREFGASYVSSNVNATVSMQSVLAEFDGNNAGRNVIMTIADSFIYGKYLTTGSFLNTTSVGNTMDRCVFRWLQYWGQAGSTFAMTYCDAFGIFPSVAAYTFYQGANDGATFDNMYIAGYRGKDKSVYDTYVSGTSTVQTWVQNLTAMTNIRTTRNFPFTPASIAISSITSNSAVVDWDSGFKTKHRIKIGTASGVYSYVYEPDYCWSDYTGLRTIMTSTPSITIPDLPSGTPLFILVESYDLALDIWVPAVAEETFTTIAIPVVLQNDVKTDSTSYFLGDTVTVDGTIQLDSDTVDTNVLVQVRRFVGDAVVATLLNEDYSFVANTAVTLAAIKGMALTYNAAIAQEEYIRVTLSAGTPVISAAETDLTTEYGFVVDTLVPRISALDISTDEVTYGSGDTITVEGAVMLNLDSTGVSVKVEMRKLSDDSLVATLVNTTADFLSGVSRTLTNINGAAITTSTTVLDSYYVKVILSGGVPELSVSSDLDNIYGFKVQDITVVELPATAKLGSTDFSAIVD